MTHYQTLGIEKTATQEDIKRAYRRLASQHHPDKGGDTAKFQEIQTAYDTLSDPEKRQEYDNPNPFKERFNGGWQSTGPNVEDLFRNFGFHFGDGFANQHTRRSARRNQDLRVTVQITLAESLVKQGKTLSVKTKKGRETVSITIPEGIPHNSTIKYSGLGDNFFEGLPRGDLYVVVLIDTPTNTSIRDDEIYQTVELDVLDAITGKDILVDTGFNESFHVAVPAGTQHGHKLRIKGKGLLHNGVRGNLYLEIKLVVPKNLSADKIALIKQLKNGI